MRKRRPTPIKLLNQLAGDLGVLEAASAYLRRPVGVGEVAVQINDPVGGASDFADVGVDASPCNHFHVDPSFNILKAVIYLGDTGAANGPLTYVVGSQRAAKGFWDSLIRRANEFGGLSSTVPRRANCSSRCPKGCVARLRSAPISPPTPTRRNRC